jgi:predicted DNA-binding WGR domain protein
MVASRRANKPNKKSKVKRSTSNILKITPIHLESHMGNSNKFYTIEVSSVPQGFLLDQTWGGIGMKPRRHKDWPRPTDYYTTLANVQIVVDEIVASKLKKGYVRMD